MVWTFAGAILFCGLAMWVSDALAVVTKAKLPSLFVVSLIFMVATSVELPWEMVMVANMPPANGGVMATASLRP